MSLKRPKDSQRMENSPGRGARFIARGERSEPREREQTHGAGPEGAVSPQ